MLTLQPQHPTSPNLFASSPPPSSMSSPKQPWSSLSTPMSESPPPTMQNHRVSRHLQGALLHSSSSSNSIHTPSLRFHSAEPSSTSPTPGIQAGGSKLRFAGPWTPDVKTVSVPSTLLVPNLQPGRFIRAFKSAPRAAARIINYLHGPHEVLTFCHVSKEFRGFMESVFEQNDIVRDVFLMRTVPGYQPSTTANPSWLNKAIKIDLTDIDLLLESASVSLSMYPMHALRAISPQSNSSTSSTDAVDNENATARFQTLTLTHSRFVAYLRPRSALQAQNIAASDEDDALPTSLDSPTNGHHDLVFPAPLFYYNNLLPPTTPAYMPLPTVPTKDESLAKSFKRASKERIKLSKSKSVSNMQNPENEDKTRQRRLSFKPRRKSNVTPPPPSAMPSLPSAAMSNPGSFGVSQFGSIGPSALQSMSLPVNRHARSQSQSSLTPPSFPFVPSSGRGTPPPPTGYRTPPGSSQGWQTPPPSIGYSAGGRSTPPMSMTSRRRKRISSYVSNDTSGLMGSPLQGNRSMPALTPPPGSAMGDLFIPPSASPGDIHSLSQVFRLSRAPIFRVFVPCSQVNPRVLQECMKQLNAASILPHLRAGDLVCNLGYIPDLGSDDASAAGATTEGDNGECRGWMVFSGVELLPLSTKTVVPVHDPTFVLSSPHYYSHVLLAGENPLFNLAIPVAPEARFPPEFSLMRVSNMVPMVPRKGAALIPGEPVKKHRVTRFIWLAKVECARWGHEWFIEAEGTQEGRSYIESALQDTRNGADRVWELVRDKTGRGTVYIRKAS
ncbi:hypothetical protein FRC15_001711 [Serendipita sp. 397]|nr:hypothetical protein FRC15_001711 [Serendipita sp. 397]